MTLSSKEKQALMESRIREALQPDYLHVIDESDQHLGHAGHQGGGRHFAIEIQSSQLAGLNRVAAHRRIYALLDDLLLKEVHALRIIIVKS